MRWPLTPLLLFFMLMAMPAEAETPTFSDIALGTPQDLVLLGRDGVKVVASDGVTTSIQATFKATLETGDRVRGEEVFHFRDSKLVGGDRRIRLRKGKESRIFFWRTYLEVRLVIEQACEVGLVLHEPGAALSWEEAAETGGPYVPGPVWRGADHWSARCEGTSVVTEVRLIRESPTDDTPIVIYSLMKVEEKSKALETQTAIVGAELLEGQSADAAGPTPVVAHPEGSEQPAARRSDPSVLRTELQTLLQEQEPVSPREANVLAYGVRLSWPAHRKGEVFCGGSVEFLDGTYVTARCNGEWLSMARGTVHWSEINSATVVAGMAGGRQSEEKTLYCVLLNGEQCLSITDRADAVRIEQIVDALRRAEE